MGVLNLERSLGRAGYDAYRDHMRARRPDGTPMPHWGALPGDVRAAWEAVADGVVRAAAAVSIRRG